MHDTSAQRRSEVFIGAGILAGFIKNGSPVVEYTPRVLPGIQSFVLIPVKGRVSLKTGLGYEQWGWNAANSYTDSLQTKSESFVRIRLHALTIPLEVVIDVKQNGRLHVRAIGGMSYAFLTAADARWTVNEYARGQLFSSDFADYHPGIALIPDGSRIKPVYDYATFYRFSTCMRGDIAISYRNRYILQLFGTLGLTDLTGGEPDSLPLRVATIGCMFAIRVL